MNWLTAQPVIGPVLTRLMRTRAWRAYEQLERVHWTRLAAAITFVSFVALFPLITVAAAVGAALLSKGQLHHLQDQFAQQIPGISDQLDLETLVTNAGAIGVVAGVLLLVTGAGWVGSLRECLRAVWEEEDAPENPVLLKLKDGAVLLGLGAVGLVAMGGSAFASSAVGAAADRLGLAEGGVGTVLLFLAGLAIAVLADFVLLAYLLTRLPRVQPDRHSLLVAGLIGAVGFELLKLLLSGYLQGVAGKSMYGAFGVPIALMLWINLMSKLLLYCAAWTATQDRPAAPGEAAPEAGTGEGEPAAEPRSPAAGDAEPQDPAPFRGLRTPRL